MMNLESPLNLKTVGDILRGSPKNLSPDDVRTLVENGPVAERNAVKTLQSHHHRFAMLLAAGFNVREVAELTRFSPGTIYRLNQTPAFKALIQYYRNHVADQVSALVREVQVKGLQMLEVATSRALESPESVDFKDLTKFTTDLLDRGGAGPTSTQVNAQIPIDPQNLKGDLDRGEIVDIEASALGEADSSEISEAQDEGPFPAAGEGDSVSEEMGEDDDGESSPLQLPPGAVV